MIFMSSTLQWLWWIALTYKDSWVIYHFYFYFFSLHYDIFCCLKMPYLLLFKWSSISLILSQLRSAHYLSSSPQCRPLLLSSSPISLFLLQYYFNFIHCCFLHPIKPHCFLHETWSTKSSHTIVYHIASYQVISYHFKLFQTMLYLFNSFRITSNHHIMNHFRNRQCSSLRDSSSHALSNRRRWTAKQICCVV